MSIRLKMMLPLLIVVASFSMVLHFYWLPHFLAHYAEDIVEEQEAALKILATAVEGPLLSGDLADVYTTLNNVRAENPSWAMLMVTRRGGGRIYPIGMMGEHKASHYIVKHTIFELERPWFDIELHLELEERLATEARLFYQIEVLVILIVFAIFLGSLIFQDRLVFMPLKSIANASRRMAGGEYEIELPSGRQDETGELIDAFGQMRDAVLQRQQAIESGEKRLKAVFDNVTNGIITTDKSGNILSANSALEEIFDYGSGEMVGRHIEDLMPGDVAAGHHHYMSGYGHATMSGNVVKMTREMQGKRKGGELFPMAITLNEVSVGDELFFLAVIDDISERVERRERQERQRLQTEARAAISQLLQQSEISLKKRFEGMFAQLFTLDSLAVQRKGGIFVHRPESSCLEMHTMVGEFSEEFVEKEQRVAYGSCLCGRVAESGELLVSDHCFDDHRHDHTFEGMKPHGHYIVPLHHAGVPYGVLFLYTEINPSHDPELLDYLRQIGDMTALAMAEERTREALEDARQKAEGHAQAKSEFLANMSHEIRTPLNGMIGSMELLRDSTLDGEQRQYVDTAYRSSERLLTLINDILDISKFEAGQVQLEQLEFDLFESLEDLVDLFANQAREKGLEIYWGLKGEVPERVVGDRTRLWQVLSNLVGNAMKFTEQGSVSVELSVVEQGSEDSLMHFAVHDTGIGIPAEAQSRIFEAFEQADGSTTRRFGGTGLGLSLCKKLSGLMGGEVGIDSTPGEGSTFWFTARLGLGSEVAVSGTEQLLAGKKVLIVDDIDANRMLFERTMESWNVGYGSAAGGEEALSLIEDSVATGQHYDVLMLDHQMPGMNGVELATKVAADYPNYGARVLLHSSAVDALYAEATACEAIDVVLRKPLRRKLLHEHLLRLVGGEHGVSTEGTQSALASDIEIPLDMSVLLVDDNAVNRMVAQAMLKKMGVVADIAEDGLQAFEMRQQKRYDIILMDVQMPVMNGFDATANIRQHEQRHDEKKSFIIALTANAMEGDAKLCLDAGMDDYLSKPFQLASLRKVIGRGLNVDSSGSQAEPLIDETLFDELQELLGEDGHSMTLQTFCSDVVKQLDNLQAAMNSGDLEVQQRICHTLKGSSGNLGMLRLHLMCKQLELQVKKDSRVISEEQLAALDSLQAMSCSEYRERLAQTD